MSGGRWRALAWPGAVCALTGLHVVVVTLLNRDFLIRGDTDAQFAPTWHHLGELVRDGQWPPLLDPDAWAGGNYAAEALFGVYNPVNLLIWVFMSLVPNLLLGVVVVKGVALMALALGTWFVCRDHGAERWSAAVVSVALPVSGYTLYWDAGSWAAGLLAFAYAPWVWWSFRRVLQGRMNPFWAFLIGSLAITQGNPYGTLAVVGIGFALLGRGRGGPQLAGCPDPPPARDLRGRLAAAGLPAAPRDGPSWRSGPAATSSPTTARCARPSATCSSSAPRRTCRRSAPSPARCRYRRSTSPGSWCRCCRGFGTACCAAARASSSASAPWRRSTCCWPSGPSKLWLFRWPHPAARVLLPRAGRGASRCCWAPASLATTSASGWPAPRRWWGSPRWLTWSEDPLWTSVAIGGPLALVLGSRSCCWVVHLRRRRGTLVLVAVLVGGTSAVLVMQALVFGENASSRVWHFPHDVSDAPGPVRGLRRPGHAVRRPAVAPETRQGRQAARVMAALPGRQHVRRGRRRGGQPYTGMGYEPFTKRLCMDYDGLG